MTEVGYVKGIQGEYALVSFKKKSGCGGNCGSCKSGCAQEEILTEVKNTLNSKIGDRVKVAMEIKVFNKMVTLAYVFPLIMMAVGIAGGVFFFKNMGYDNYELPGFLTGMAFLAIAYITLNFSSKKKSEKKETILKMVEIMEK